MKWLSLIVVSLLILSGCAAQKTFCDLAHVEYADGSVRSEGFCVPEGDPLYPAE